MATVILVRHGRTDANASGVLAGRTPKVSLDDVGQKQAERVAERIAAFRPAALVSSPLERCRQTTKAIASAQAEPIGTTVDRGLIEVDYGDWQGKKLKDLMGEPLWKTVQRQPSAASFPGGESMSAMQTRAVATVRGRDAEFEASHGEKAVWVAVSHGDIIKAVLADAYGMHLDLFQRIHVDPASVSIIRYTEARPHVLCANTHAGDLAWLAPKASDEGADSGEAEESGDGVVGGGAGPEA